VRARIAKPPTPASLKTSARQWQLVDRHTGAIGWKSFVHVRAALAQRASRQQRHEEQQQWRKGKSTEADRNRLVPCMSAREAMLRSHEKPMSLDA
jgi:hypothetical protein